MPVSGTPTALDCRPRTLYDSVVDDNSVMQNNGVTKTRPVTDYREERARGREALRLGLLDAAGRLLAQEGPEALSVRRVAEEVNASTQVLYTMFGGKEGLANELFVEGFERLGRALEAAPRSGDPLRDVIALGEAYFENALSNPNYYRVMFADAIPGFRPPEETLKKTWRTFGPLVEAVRLCAEAGLFAPGVAGDPRGAALSLWSAVHGVASLHLAGRFSGEREAREVFGRSVRSAVGGLVAEGAGGGDVGGSER